MSILDDIGDAVGGVVDSVTGGGSDSGSSSDVTSQPDTSPGSGRDTSGNLSDSGPVDLGGGSGVSRQSDSQPDRDPPDIDGRNSVDLGGGGGGSSGGGGGGGGGRSIAERTRDAGNTRQTRPDFSDVSVDDVTDPVVDTATDVRDFVQSGPDEPSVGDDDFGRGVIGTSRPDRGPIDTQPVTGSKMSNTVPVSETRDTTPNINPGVVEGFTGSGGLLSDDPGASDGLLPGSVGGVDISERRTRALAERGQSFSEGIDDSGIGGSIAAGFGTFGGDLAALPQTAESGVETVTNAPAVVDEFGAVETGQTVANFGAGAIRGTAQSAFNDPVEFGTAAGLGIVTGSAASRASELGTAGVRTRIEGFRGPDIDASDTTFQTERIEAGEQPIFETDPDAPGSVAAEEFEARARDQPDELTDAVGGGPVTLRSETDRLPGDLEAQEGNFELPGLFTSGDFAPLRFGEGGSTFGTPELRAPRLFGEPQRASAFETPEIDAIPEDRAGSGFALRDTDSGDVVETGVPQGEAARRADEVDTLERIPDPEEPGVQFLNEEADAGTAFVRPGGDRTPEFEAIFPPETRFERQTTGTISARGETGTLDIFRLADGQRPADGPDVDAGDVGEAGSVFDDSGDFMTAREVSERISSGGTVPDSTPVAPTPAISTGGAGPASSELFGSEEFDSEFSNPFDDRTPDSTRPDSTSTRQPDSRGSSSRSSGSTSSRSSPSGSPFGSSAGVFGGSTVGSLVSERASASPVGSGRPPATSTPPSGGGSSGGFGSGFGSGFDSPFGDSPGGSGGSGGSTGGSSSNPSPTRPRAESDGERFVDEELFGSFTAETPEFGNPVASGASDIFGAFGQQ